MKYLLVFLLIGCGRYPDLNWVGDRWDAHLTPFVYDFIEDIEEYGVPAGKLGSLRVLKESTTAVRARQDDDEDLLGVCITFKYDERHIRTEIYVIENLSEDDLRHTLYHELTHCAYSIDHWGEKGDIQYHTINTEIFSWQERKDRHFNELLKRIN